MQDQITSASSKTLALFSDHTLPPSSKQPPLLQVACVARCARAADARAYSTHGECFKECVVRRGRGVWEGVRWVKVKVKSGKERAIPGTNCETNQN
jgi:hypothetical protein